MMFGANQPLFVIGDGGVYFGEDHGLGFGLSVIGILDSG
jgi:hypothetical protein